MPARQGDANNDYKSIIAHEGYQLHRIYIAFRSYVSKSKFRCRIAGQT
jgi:hypothetical protein